VGCAPHLCARNGCAPHGDGGVRLGVLDVGRGLRSGGDCVVTMSSLRSVGALFLGPPASLVIGPKPLIIEVGGHPNIDVVVTDANRNTIRTRTVTFASRILR